MAAGRQRDGVAGTPEPDAVDAPVAEETDSASTIRRRGATGAALLTVRAAAAQAVAFAGTHNSLSAAGEHGWNDSSFPAWDVGNS